MQLLIIIKIIPINLSWERKWEVRLPPEVIYEKDSIRGYLPDEDITLHGGQALQKPGGNWLLKMITGWEVLYGQDLIIVENQHHFNGQISIRILVSWICAAFQKIFITTIKVWWTDKDVLHISPHWNWQKKRGQPIDVWVNSNADNVELFLNGKSLGKKDMPRNSHLQWSVNYEPGTFEAIAYKKGKKLTAKVETTDEPEMLWLHLIKQPCWLMEKMSSVINISVVDREGCEVPDADNMIRFSISGNGKIIGVGNGDPSSHEPDKCIDGAWQRSLFNGKCQVIVQSDKKMDR